ncbi:MAG: bifunctional 5,10-methylenetetrahydrofolate dehydrogenase/5,10-methenyltetrahydrofolate cyclohydrolase [Candidatus Coatesbacteria bacterium]|nr:bifunctional 5,10-methylenetetrahydrofolate dehydrogenase/5,10-methenyltetrahydrofolate cyclohydrolase [Candidatus Coatesbacteria bacterium]
MKIELMNKMILAKPVVNILKEHICNRLSSISFKPKLTVIFCGDDEASSVYVGKKEIACSKLGIESCTLKPQANQSEILNLIDQLNSDPAINGILVQLPLPSGVDADLVLDRISPLKDVDGFHPANSGLLNQGRPRFIPCTPLGISFLLQAYGIKTSGKRAVVLGRSNIVGKPLFSLLSSKADYGNASVTLCHSYSRDLKEICKEADILFAAIGKPALVTEEFVKEGSFVIDVGIHRLEEGKIIGDVCFERVHPVVEGITPVPKGVGPMTIYCLMYNTVKAAYLQNNLDFEELYFKN